MAAAAAVGGTDAKFLGLDFFLQNFESFRLGANLCSRDFFTAPKERHKTRSRHGPEILMARLKLSHFKTTCFKTTCFKLSHLKTMVEV